MKDTNYVSNQAISKIKSFLKNKEYNAKNLTQILNQLNQGIFPHRQSDLNKEIRRQVENKIEFLNIINEFEDNIKSCNNIRSLEKWGFNFEYRMNKIPIKIENEFGTEEKKIYEQIVNLHRQRVLSVTAWAGAKFSALYAVSMGTLHTILNNHFMLNEEKILNENGNGKIIKKILEKDPYFKGEKLGLDRANLIQKYTAPIQEILENKFEQIKKSITSEKEVNKSEKEVNKSEKEVNKSEGLFSKIMNAIENSRKSLKDSSTLQKKYLLGTIIWGAIILSSYNFFKKYSRSPIKDIKKSPAKIDSFITKILKKLNLIKNSPHKSLKNSKKDSIFKKTLKKFNLIKESPK